MRKYDIVPFSLSHTLHRRDNEYFGRYRGTVLDNEDPDNRGRCKVFVYGIYDSIFNADKGRRLPWAEPCQPLFAGGMGDKCELDDGGCNGTFQCPDIGSTVWVFFDSGDITRPVMFGQTTDANGKFSTEHCKIKWDDMYVDFHRDAKTKKNTITVYSQTDIKEYANDNDIRRLAGNNIKDTANWQIDIEALNYDVNIKSGNNVNVNAANNINIKAAKTINVEAGTEINIKAPKVNITGDVDIKGKCHISDATNIDSTTTINADAIISGKSFLGHTHMGDGGPSPAPTSPPL